MSEPDCSEEERLKQLLKILDTFCTELSAAKMQKLAIEAKSVVNKMQNILERSLVEQVVELVQARNWDEVIEKMKQNFPNGLSVAKFEEILDLVYHNGSVEHLVNALDWVRQLDVVDVKLQPIAYEALYEQLKLNKVANQPQVLLLRLRVGALPAGRVSNNLLTQLDEDFWTIVGQIAEAVRREDYSIQQKINAMIHNEIPGEVDVIMDV
jgi:hypothetical protein